LSVQQDIARFVLLPETMGLCGSSHAATKKKLESKKVVMIIGGGYAGIKLAKTLDAKVNVVLVEKRDHFFHCIGSLRGAVQPDMAPKQMIPYSKLLTHGTFLQATVVELQEQQVVLSDGRKFPFDACVCATGWTGGTAFWSPDSAATGKERLTQLKEVHDRVKAATSVLIIGGGAVGIEMAGELLDAVPDVKMTLISSGEKLMSGPGMQAKFQEKLAAQLSKRGVELVFGERVESGVDVTKAGMHPASTVTTASGKTFSADVVFVCTGPKTVLPEKHPFALSDQGQILVERTLRCTGTAPHLFALGDCAQTGDVKNAYHGAQQAALLAKNILTFCEKGPTATLAPYANTPPAFIVPIGRNGGASQLPFGVVGPMFTSAVKGKDLFTEQFWKDMGFKSSQAHTASSDSALLISDDPDRLQRRMSAVMNIDEETLKKEYGSLEG